MYVCVFVCVCVCVCVFVCVCVSECGSCHGALCLMPMVLCGVFFFFGGVMSVYVKQVSRGKGGKEGDMFVRLFAREMCGEMVMVKRSQVRGVRKKG